MNCWFLKLCTALWGSSFLFLVSLALSGPALSATLGSPWSLRDAVGSAEAIFEGTVVEVSYRNSDDNGNKNPVIAHTFVTYQVGRVVRGGLSSDRVTLRIMGGWSPSTGRIMLMSHAPRFSVGNHDIVMVAKNGQAACPLVLCGLGRFRIVDGYVYGNNGRSLTLDGQDDLKPGRHLLSADVLSVEYPPAPQDAIARIRQELNENPDLSDAEREILERRIADMSAPRVISVQHQSKTPAPPSTVENKLDVDRFIKLLSAISDGDTSGAGPGDSVSADEPFVVPAMELTPLQRSGHGSRAGPDLTLEQQMLRQNNGNPVLRSN